MKDIPQLVFPFSGRLARLISWKKSGKKGFSVRQSLGTKDRFPGQSNANV